MTKPRTQGIFRPLLLVLVFSLMAIGTESKAAADEVVLNPGYIDGTFRWGTEPIARLYVRAYSGPWPGDFAAEQYVYPNNATSTDYHLEPNVPAGTTLDYNLHGHVYLNNRVDPWGYDRWYDLAYYYGPQGVPVSEFATSVADIIVEPGYIEGTVTVNGGELYYGYIYAYRSSADGYTYSRHFVDSSGNIRLPVVPNQQINVYGHVYLVGSDTRVNIPSASTVPSTQTYVDVAAGQTVNVGWEINVPDGVIAGDVTFNGPVDVTRHTVLAYGPSYGVDHVYENGPYAIEELEPGTYWQQAYTYMRGYQDYLYHPYSSFSPAYNPVQVDQGATTTTDIASDQAFIDGNLSFTGTHTIEEAYYAYLYAYGVYPTNAYGSQIQHRVNIATGDVNAVVTEGSWRPYIIRIYWYNAIPTEYLYTRMDLYDYTTAYEPIAVAAGATATRNLAYKTGSVTATFRVEGGGLLSNPRLVGWCHEYDELDQLLWSYYVDSWNYAQVNVEVGTVTFVGLDGTCDIAAEAEVGGSRTIFGRPAIQAIAGAQQGVDIGGPSLTVEFPEPDYISETSIVTVTGTATDDVQVSSVTVNGITAALTSTDNPDDPNEVSFSVDIVLAAKGPNEVVTVATDTSGKTATDTRTVYWDEYPPHLSWKPDDGTITSESVITVEGKATNDAEVASVTVNGVEVTLTPTGNPNDPLEVSFSTTVNLVEGANNITVVATDISTRTITQTHTVTYVVNNPPVAVDDFAETGEDTPVTIEVLSNDSDLDGDPLSVNIFGPAAHGAVTVNEDNTVTYEPEPGFSGMDSFTYTVSDWADDSNVALVTITVVPAPEPVVTEEILVELHTIDQSTRGGATVTPVEGAQVRVYDRDNEDFRGAYGGKNPKGALYPIIFDADFGLVATCATGPDGRATCEEDAPGQYLVLVGVVDGSDTVIVGKPKSLEESVGADGDGIADPITHMGNCFGPIDPNTGLPAPLLDTNGDWTDTDCDGVLDTGATKEFPIVKVIKKNGEKQIGHGSKRVVKGN